MGAGCTNYYTHKAWDGYLLVSVNGRTSIIECALSMMPIPSWLFLNSSFRQSETDTLQGASGGTFVIYELRVRLSCAVPQSVSEHLLHFLTSGADFWQNRGFNDKSVKTSKIVHLDLLIKIGYGPIA